LAATRTEVPIEKLCGTHEQPLQKTLVLAFFDIHDVKLIDKIQRLRQVIVEAALFLCVLELSLVEQPVL